MIRCGCERCLATQGMERKWSISICSVLGVVVEKDFFCFWEEEEEAIVTVEDDSV